MPNATECVRYVDKHPDLTNDPMVFTIFTVLYLHIFFLGILGNSAIFTVQNIFILNLAASNVLICLTSLPVTFITNVYKTWYFSSPICKLIPLVQGASILVSTFSLAAIALDRYNLVVQPHKPTMGTKGASMTAMGIWVVSVIVCIPYGWYMDVDRINGLCGEFCTEHWPLVEVRKGYAFLVLITQFLFPFATMAFCYYNIFSRLQQRAEKKLQKLSERTQLLETRSATMTSSNMTSEASCNDAVSAAEKEQRVMVIAQQRRTTTILASMVLLFGMTWLPHNVFTLILEYDEQFFHRDETTENLMYFASSVAHLISMITNVTNPFLYAWLNPTFKEILLKSLKLNKRKKIAKTNQQESFVRMNNYTTTEANNF